jgi:uncharacterized protein YecT (DUF1311 family)
MSDRLRILIIALALAALSTPGYAQITQTTARSDKDKKSDAEADKAYRDMIKNVPDKPRNTDPWQDVRGADATAATSAAGKGTASSKATGKIGTKHTSAKPASNTKPE